MTKLQSWRTFFLLPSVGLMKVWGDSDISFPLQRMCNVLSCNLFVHLWRNYSVHISEFLQCHEMCPSASISQSLVSNTGWISWHLILAWRTSKPSLPPCQDSARQCRKTRGGTLEDPLERKVAFKRAWSAHASCWNPSTLVIDTKKVQNKKRQLQWLKDAELNYDV